MASPIVKYCKCMEELKRRLNVINGIVTGHSPLGHEDFDGEIACLHLRKSLELIAFSSLSAHNEAYTQAYNDFYSNWNAKRLLSKIEKIHPGFYPKPVKFSQVGDGGVKQFGDVKEGFLTHEDFVFLYGKCSEILHTRNPFKLDPRIVNFERSISEWATRIQRLFDIHYIQLVNTMDIWLVQMHQPIDGKVHAYMSQAVPPDETIPPT